MGRMYGGKEGRAHRKYRFNAVHSMDHIGRDLSTQVNKSCHIRHINMSKRLNERT